MSQIICDNQKPYKQKLPTKTMNNKLALLEYGLTEKEADCYIYLLRQGESSANEISKNTGILRQTIYDILNKLEHKGIISQVSENNTTYFMAEKPEIFLEKLEEKKEIINLALPSLESLKNLSQSSTNVKMYKGLNGIKSLFTLFLESPTPILTIQPEIKGEETLKEFYVKNFSVKRIEKKIPIKILREKIVSKLQEELATKKNEFREVRLSEEVAKIETHYIIYGDNLAMISYGEELSGIEIKDKTFTDSFRILFNNIWEKAKENRV